MIDVWHVLRYSLQDLWDEFVILVILNVLWSLTAVLPLLPLVLFQDPLLLLAAIPLFSLPLALVSGGIAFVTNQIARGRLVGWGALGQGVRRYWAKSLAVAAINGVVLFLWLFNLRFYSLVLPEEWQGFVLVVWLVLGAYWLAAQVFWFPMILELEKEQVFVALRSALAMVLITPAFSLTLLVVLLLFILLSLALAAPMVLFSISLLSLIGNHATRSRLAFIQKRPYQPRSRAADTR